MLSPKQIGTICLVFSLILISTKSFSENIPNNPTCDNATLGVYSGSAALEPDWDANKIPISWYNNNTLITDVTTAESECTYDGTIDVATEPTRTGFTFKGWRVRPQMDFSTLTSLGDSIVGYGKEAGKCGRYDGTWREGEALCKEDAHLHDLNDHEWKVMFSTGILYGVAKCSAKSGDRHGWLMQYRDDWAATIAELEVAQGDKKHCWCLSTGWQSNGENQIKYTPSVSLPWVFTYAYGSLATCSGVCAGRCADDVRSNSGFRNALFSTAAAQ